MNGLRATVEPAPANPHTSKRVDFTVRGLLGNGGVHDSGAVDEPEGRAGCSLQEQPTPPLAQVQAPGAIPLFFDDDLHSDAVCGCDDGHVVALTAANGLQRAGALNR